jgi:hypothetical protein
MKSHHLRTLGVLVAALVLIVVVTSGSVSASGTFSPTVSLELSTTRATAHPDARLTIDNSGSAADENIKSMTMRLPDGLWGSMAAATKCDYDDVEVAECSVSSQIGTVDSTATIDQSDARLRGKVYLTEPAPDHASTDPAGISVVVPAKVDNVDLGNVVVNARVIVRNGPTGASSTPNAVGPVQGVNTIVDEVPQSITDSHGRSVSFHLEKMRIDLVSDLDGPKPPLLTNPSSCSTLTVNAQFTSWQSSSATVADQTPPTTTDCSTAKFAPSVEMVASNTQAGSLTGLTAQIDFPTGSATAKSVRSYLPAGFAPNFPSFGAQADQCPASTATLASSSFDPTACPAQAKIGTVTLTTPLLADPVVGDVWLINKSPLPWLGIDINPGVSPSNPKGVIIRLSGVTATPQLDPTCDPLTDPSGQCQSQISVLFNNIPDAPVTSMTLSMDGPDRTGVGNTTLSGKILSIATASDPMCQPKDEFVTSMISNAGASVTSTSVNSQAMTGCNAQAVALPDDVGSVVGKTTADHTPDVVFTGVGPFTCAVDQTATAAPCTSPWTTQNLNSGVHRVFVTGDNGQAIATRGFSVQDTPPTPDTTAPEATITSPPTSIADSDVTLQFSSNESANFQCTISLGGAISGAYLPCSDGLTVSGSASAQSLNSGPLRAGLMYTFAVRAQDAAGNVGAPDTATFTVDIPFAPSFQADVSDTAARAHPDLDVTIENPSHEDLKDIEFQMPNGFFGALTGVASLCSLTDADAGNCPTSSKVGTVDTEAAVDESTVRVSGDVFLTQPRNSLLEPASLSIKIHPAIQEVVFDDIVVTANLKVRGEAEGIDTFALDLPTSATNAIDGTTEFDMRKMVLKLRTGAGAAHPLLTNPSSCAPASFDAKFTGADSSVQTASQTFDVTGCSSLPFGASLAITQSDSDTGSSAPAASSDAKRVNVNFSANLTANPDGSAIKNVTLTLPEPLTIDVGHLPPVCQIAQAALKACPASSAVGTVVANTPLLPEPLNGTVYVLKSETALPRLLIALRGRINTDIIAVNRFVGQNFNIIQTEIENVPDAPISSFSMMVNRFLMTRETTCNTPPSAWNITGSMTAQSGAVTPVNNPLQFTCNTSPQADNPTFKKPKVKGKGKKFTLSTAVQTQDGKKIKKLTIKLPSGLKFESKATTAKKIAKYVQIKADGKKLKAKCIKRKRSNVIEINFCKKQVRKISVSMKKGSLNARKKFTNKKPPKLSVKVVDSSNKSRTARQIP